jgi:F-type H+-transporting ATPase subunit delta
VIGERGEGVPVQEELAAWEKMTAGNDLWLEAFSNPTVPYQQKQKLLNALIARTKVRPTTANFLRVLLRNQRLPELPQVNAKLAQILDERSGVASAQVVSARPVSEAIKASLVDKLGQLTGKKVRLSFETDETLLGGIVTKIGSTIYDGSVRNQLRRLGEELAG